MLRNTQKQVSEQHEAAFAGLQSNLDKMGVSHSLSHDEKRNAIQVNKIVVPKEQRNKGIGTAAMNSITSHADKYGKRVELTPSSDFGGSKIRLKSFYGSMGFVNNEGKNKDFTTRHTMYREPK